MTGLRLGVLINPTAGGGRSRSLGPKTLAVLNARGHSVHDLSAADFDTAMIAARQGVVEGLDALVVVGGDGMTHLGANVVAHTTLPLGIVATGTGNDIARALGLPAHDVAASCRAIEQGLEVGPRSIDAAQVSGPDLSMREWYVGVLSAGFDAAVNERANTIRWPRGESRYVRAVLRELVTYSPYGYRITVDGDTRELAGVLVSVANGTMFGGGMRIAPGAKLDDGLLDIVLAGPASRAQLATIFPRVFKGTHVHHDLVEVIRGRDVLLEAWDGGRLPPAARADGERLGPLPLRITVVPQAVRVLAPKPAHG